MTLQAKMLQELSTLTLSILKNARLILVGSQGLVGVGTIRWSNGKLGPELTRRTISRNGNAS
ncbi:MFS transporter, partial [Pseudomonas syringae pv. tagetis]